MDVSYIIVNFKTSLLTSSCIASIIKYTSSISYEIIVIDNNSGDDSVKQICQLHPEVIMISNVVNLGFGQANNQGIAIAKGKYVFLLNSDTWLISNVAKSFFDYMEVSINSNVACCGAALLDSDGRAQWSYGNFPSLLEAISSLGPFLFYKRYYIKHLSSAVRNCPEDISSVDYICGANMFIRKSILDKIGSFDPDFFLYFEETELSYRMKKAGYLSKILPQERIVHIEGASKSEKSEFNI
jgi:GT2 family glycosyltransferase